MLSVYSVNESSKWDDIVKSFGDHDVYYLSGYAKAFQTHGDGEPLLFYYEHEGTRAMNVVMKRDISKVETFKNKIPSNTYFDLSTPYGYGGFWSVGDDSDLLNQEYDHYCRENGFISEFVRFHLFGNFHLHYNGRIESNSHNVVCFLEEPLEMIYRNFEHKVRKNVKKAISSGLMVEIDTSGERINDFIDIYNKTMMRTNARDYFLFTDKFFETINNMKNNYAYFHVFFEDKVISSELVLEGPENCYSFLGGTDCDFFNLRPNDFLKFEIIKWAKSRGKKKFILGGGNGEDDGIFRYKKSFAPNGVYDFFIGKKIFNEEVYDMLVDIRKKGSGSDMVNLQDKMDGYFPKYRIPCL